MQMRISKQRVYKFRKLVWEALRLLVRVSLDSLLEEPEKQPPVRHNTINK